MVLQQLHQAAFLRHVFPFLKQFRPFFFISFLLVSFSAGAQTWDHKASANHFKQATKWQEELLREKNPSNRKQNYLKIIKEFERVWLKDPHYSGCDDAMFYAGQLWKMAAENCKEKQLYKKSLDQFKALIKEYPQSDFSARAQLEMIRIFCFQGQAAPAREQLAALLKRYPKSKEAEKARQAVAALDTAKATRTGKSAKSDRNVSITEQAASVPAVTENQTAAGSVLVTTIPPSTAREKESDILPPPEPAQPPRLGGLTLTRTLGLKINRVVLDPGHGGHDTGTISKSGLMEKDLVLDLAIRLRSFLQERMGMEVILTRETDVFLPLEERTALANRNKADLFISIHANSSRNSKINGVETFFLSWANSKEDQELAIRENAAASSTVADLQDLVRKIAKNEKIGESRELASYIQGDLIKYVAGFSPGAKDRGVKQAPFVVLIGASMPSVLAEVSFLSNPKVASRLSSEDAREHLADGLFTGIERYVSSLSRQAGNYQRTLETGP